jgi:hypothetical protein
MRLSKSQYCRGLQCEKLLWLYRHQPELATPPGPMDQMIFDQGTAIGELACQRFPGGTLISEDHTQPTEAVAATKRAVDDGAQTLYEAAAIFDNVLIRADILNRNSDGTWDLIEVKSSSAVKDVHRYDLSIQRYVLEGAGYRIDKTCLMYINNKYELSAGIDVERLFCVSDETESVTSQMPNVKARVEKFHELLKQDDAPVIGIGRHCKNPYLCAFKASCWRHIPMGSIFDIASIRTDKAAALWESGIENLADIPDDYKLSAKQRRQVTVSQTGAAHIDAKAIAAHLADLVYPLYFLDFETVGPAVPPYDGLRPFENLPVQASVHIQEHPEGPLLHKELLAEPDVDPRAPMADFLCQAIGPTGSVIAYNASFEAGCLKTLEAFSPPQSAALSSIRTRLWDLAIPFRKGHYIDAKFQGSWSLKYILPALVPAMTYEGMDIADGGNASKLYFDAMQGTLKGAEKDAVFKALREYCAQDTLATVEVLRVLLAVV